MSATHVEAVRFIGKCRVRGCKHVVRVDDSPMIRSVWTKGGPWAAVEGEPRCPEHGRIVLSWSMMHGTYNADKGCNERCMGATGPSCECSCGGENHGGRYQL